MERSAGCGSTEPPSRGAGTLLPSGAFVEANGTLAVRNGGESCEQLNQKTLIERLVTMAAQVGMEDAGGRGEAVVRLAAIRGESVSRPWHWKAVSR